jgi:enoyl-CoA hydratase/carnithine racemase
VESPIISYKENKKGIIRLNRPAEKNTFSFDFAQTLNKDLRAFDADADVRVIIIEAEGKHFSTGIALDEFVDKEPYVLQRILTATKPIWPQDNI